MTPHIAIWRRLVPPEGGSKPLHEEVEGWIPDLTLPSPPKLAGEVSVFHHVLDIWISCDRNKAECLFQLSALPEPADAHPLVLSASKELCFFFSFFFATSQVGAKEANICQ